MLLPLAVSCGSESEKQEGQNDDDASQEEDSGALPKDKKYTILFIGNSYTQYNDMSTKIFKPMAEAAGYDVVINSVLKGGYTLQKFADPNDQYGAKVEELLTNCRYDFVILQEQSLRPVNDPARFYGGVRKLCDRISATGATPVLYATWGRKTGSQDLADLQMTNESMTWALDAAYSAIGKEKGADVAHVGLAFFDVYTSEKSIELYASDLYHPSYNGSYLAAATLFAKIFKVDPTEIDYNGDLKLSVADRLKEAARDAVFNTPEIPEEYRTSSEDVVSETSDTSMMRNLKTIPKTKLISVLQGGSYPNGKGFSGILGTKGQIASPEYSDSKLSDWQKKDIADIGYGVSMIGVEKMNSDAKGYTTAIENLVNGHWGSSLMASVTFDDKMYDVDGSVAVDGKYRALITLNFGKECRFDAIGFASGNLDGFPGAADVYVSVDGKNWEIVPSACWDRVNGGSISACTDSADIHDPWNGNSTKTVCLFDMAAVYGQYVRIGVVIGRSDKAAMYNTMNTRELLVFGDDAQ